MRHLKIGYFYGDHDIQGSEADLLAEYHLADVRAVFKNSKDFSWDVRISLPDDVFAVLTTKWPLARVHVSSLDRNGRYRTDARRYIAMDMKLLSLPQLYSLDSTVYGSDRIVSGELGGYWSEFHLLKSCLLQAPGLKSLRLSAVGHSQNHSTWRKSRQQRLDFAPGDMLPALESIAWNFGYDFSPKHCSDWFRVMDWSKLQRLDFGFRISPSA